jgi:hypothetical protein
MGNRREPRARVWCARGPRHDRELLALAGRQGELRSLARTARCGIAWREQRLELSDRDVAEACRAHMVDFQADRGGQHDG